MTGHEVSVYDRDQFKVGQTDHVKPFIPDGFASVFKFAELINASGMAPKDMNTTEKISVAIFHGMEVGLTPMAALQSIAVINGRPSVWGDGALGMVRASGLLEDFEETFEGGDVFEADGKTPNRAFKAICRVKRKGAPRAVTSEFSVGDAIDAGLFNKTGPWTQYRKRMLKMRARSFAIRDEFTDVMRGLVLAEEAQDYDEMRDITPKAEEPPPSPAITDDGKQKRTRATKAAATGNKYQDDAGGKADATDAEVISQTTAKAAEKQQADKPAEDVQQQAAKTEAPKEKPAAPKEKADKVEAAAERQAEADAGTIMLDSLLSEVGPDKPLKEHLKYLHKILGAAMTQDAAKEAWGSREKLTGTVTSQRDFIDRLRNWHKERIVALEAAAADGDSPPSAEEQTLEFDYSGFLHALEMKLGEQDNPDDVNKVYSQIVTPAEKAGAITAQQIEDDVKPLLAAALERTDSY